MEKGYTILEHPSDLGIEAHGETMNVAFEQAATALMSVMLDPTTVDGLEQRHVEIAAVDAEQLLVKWLTEILYLYDGQQFAAKRFTIERLTPTALAAMIAAPALPGDPAMTMRWP